MAWTVNLSPSAEREVRKLDRSVRSRLEPAILGLAERPLPVGVKKMQGPGAERYRIRVGDWRIVYTIDYKTRIILIERVGHRREVYR